MWYDLLHLSFHNKNNYCLQVLLKQCLYKLARVHIKQIMIAKCGPIFWFQRPNIPLEEKLCDPFETKTALILSRNISLVSSDLWYFINKIQDRTQATMFVFLPTVAPNTTQPKTHKITWKQLMEIVSA